MDEMFKYKLFFASISEIGYAAIRKLIEEFENEKNIYELSDNALERCSSLTTKQKNKILEYRKKYDFNKCNDYLISKDIKVVFYDDDNYPRKLKNIGNMPYQLFYSGKLPDENKPSVAIVGARMCSNYGYENAKLFSKELAEKGVQIISGMASGIDGVSQKTAIENEGDSFAILGSGVDVCYPKSNRYLYELLIQKGGVISEFPPGTKPASYNFPVRNRIISGLADILLVVEAKEKSGTAITVNMALEQGKDVYAIPGKICDSLSAGCNKMIKEGAGVALSPEDILNDLNITYLDKLNVKNINKLTVTEAKIIKILGDKRMNIDEIYSLIKDVEIYDLRSIVFELVLKGVLTERAGLYEVFKY